MEEINVLSDVALSQPHAALAAFTHGMIHKFTYLCRTTPDIDQLLSPLENLIRSRLLPAVCGQSPPNDLVRDLLGLPPRLGGIGISDPSGQSIAAYSSSVRITAPLVNLIAQPLLSSVRRHVFFDSHAFYSMLAGVDYLKVP